MNRDKIAEIASKMQTREDFLFLLNMINNDEFEGTGNGMLNNIPFTNNHLVYFCNPKNEKNRFKSFKIKKKSGGYREISSPCNGVYRALLRAVFEFLKSIYTPNCYAMGFVESRSVVTNAQKHINHNYIFNIDIKDFFHSIEQVRVCKRLQAKPYCLSKEIANLVAGLCSMKITRVKKDDLSIDNLDKQYAYVLPQGSPVSPIISNMVCEKLDFLLGALAKRFGLTYTRYADDITFSSNHYVYAKNGSFRKELRRIILNQGFKINEGKTRLCNKGQCHEVTGIIVSNKTNVTKKYMRELRTILHIWDKYGYNDAYLRFLHKYKLGKGHVKHGCPDLINVMEGKLLYMKMVKGNSDPVYLKLYDRFRQLVNSTLIGCKKSTKGNIFIETYKLVDFEKYVSFSPVMIKYKEDGKPYAYFSFSGCQQFVSIYSKLKKEDLLKKQGLEISLCRGIDNRTFWLIHQSNASLLKDNELGVQNYSSWIQLSSETKTRKDFLNDDIYKKGRNDFLNHLEVVPDRREGKKVVYVKGSLSRNSEGKEEEGPKVQLFYKKMEETKDRNTGKKTLKEVLENGSDAELHDFNSRTQRVLDEIIAPLFLSTVKRSKRRDTAKVITKEDIKKNPDIYKEEARRLSNLLNGYNGTYETTGIKGIKDFIYINQNWKIVVIAHKKLQHAGDTIEESTTQFKIYLQNKDNSEFIIELGVLTAGKNDINEVTTFFRNLLWDSEDKQIRHMLKWQVPYSDIEDMNGSPGVERDIARENIAQIVDDGILEVAASSLGYDIDTVELRNPFKGDGSIAYTNTEGNKPKVLNSDNASTSKPIGETPLAEGSIVTASGLTIEPASGVILEGKEGGSNRGTGEGDQDIVTALEQQLKKEGSDNFKPKEAAIELPQNAGGVTALNPLLSLGLNPLIKSGMAERRPPSEDAKSLQLPDWYDLTDNQLKYLVELEILDPFSYNDLISDPEECEMLAQNMRCRGLL